MAPPRPRSIPPPRTVTLADGKVLAFAKLVFATGSRPIRLPVAGADLRGVLTFRDMADVGSIVARRASRHARRRDRRRAPGHRGGLWPRQGRRQGHARSPHGSPDGAPARRTRRGDAQARSRGQRHRGAARSRDERVPSAMGASRRSSSKDGRIIAAEMVVVAVGIKPNARDCGRGRSRGQSRHHRRRSPSRPTRPTSSPSANAPSIAASATDWSSPLTTRHACSPSGSPDATPATTAA